MPLSSALQVREDRFDVSPERTASIQEILDAFEDGHRTAGFLPQAEAAERTHPGHPIILCLAATAALFDAKPQRARLYLKRFSKRYVPTLTHHLLSALALAQLGKGPAARVALERHRLDDFVAAFQHFPGGWYRRDWLAAQFDGIFVQRVRSARTRPMPRAKPAPQTRGAPAPPKRPGVQASPVVEAEKIPAPLPLVALDIPVDIEIDLAPLIEGMGTAPEADGRWFLLRERLSHLGLAQGFDELLCLPHLNGIETFWYQTETVRKVLKQFRGRVLLADEVGLGKTVEAGMVLKEYMLRGMAESALILVPPSLIGQWAEELHTKFGVACATTHDALLRSDPECFWSQPRIIASLALARRAEHASHLASRAFDLVIVDEAHHLRERTSQSYRVVDGLNKRFLLLLSATPVQNNLVELYNLLTLLKPGIFKTLREFRAAYMVPGNSRQPANPDRLRELMRSVMIRNTRAVVALKLPRRHAATVRVEAGAAEASAYRELVTALRVASSEGKERLAVANLLGAAGSSPRAAAEALARFTQKRANEGQWQALAEQWSAVDAAGKERALLDILRRNPGEKKIVFVHYRATLERLADVLSREAIAFVRFDGSMSGPDKDAAIGEFRVRADVLLCTESGGEGRNIQFCNTLVNYDVPWNPMAIEQRIGRIDRIGQTREVFVFNLATQGTIEDEILKLLDEKIAMFELVVGEAGAILGQVEDSEGEFSSLVLDAWLAESEGARATALESLGQRLMEARTRHEGAKSLDETLFGEEFETT